MPISTAPRIVIFGATGKVGQQLTHKLAAQGRSVLCVGRRAEVLSTLPGEALVLDLDDVDAASSPIGPNDVVINAAHARHTATILALCPPDIRRLIILGSTRYLSRFADAAGDEVRAAIKLLEATDLPWVLLHPTMIYGAQGENNVQRIASLIKRFHVIPLPGGGRSLIQPIHVEDVVEAVIRAVDADGIDRRALHIAGPAPVSYADFIRAIARAMECGVWVMPVPYVFMAFMARLTAIVPGVPLITKNEVLRLLEDKAVDIQEMRDVLGIAPRPLEEGLRDALQGPSAVLSNK